MAKIEYKTSFSFGELKLAPPHYHLVERSRRWLLFFSKSEWFVQSDLGTEIGPYEAMKKAEHVLGLLTGESQVQGRGLDGDLGWRPAGTEGV